MKKRNIYSNALVHVFNRGSRKELLFFGEHDYSRFLSRLKEYSTETGNKIVQYCLLPNHFHLLVRVKDSKSLSTMMQRLAISHSRYLIYRYNLVGSIFQNRYKTVVVDSDSQLAILSRYIHRNPREFFSSVAAIRHYPWSSYRSYISDVDYLISRKEKDAILDIFRSIKEYQDFVEAEEISIQSELKQEAYARMHLDVGVRWGVEIGSPMPYTKACNTFS